MLQERSNAGPTTLYSAKDLLNFLGCPHSTTLDLQVVSGRITTPPDGSDEYLELLQLKGIEHERRYLEALKAQGKSVHEIQRVDELNRMAEATRCAMREGVDVIYQGALLDRPWHGYSDFLIRIDTPSKLGSFSYEVLDTKLARRATPKHVVQLWLYSQLVALEQELMPEHAYVVLGDGTKTTLRLKDFHYYCDHARERFLDFTAAGAATEAEPCQHCTMCRWSEECEAEWKREDHLSLVARMSGSQRRKLIAAGVTTVRELASLPEEATVSRLHGDTLTRLRSQARLQLVKRDAGRNECEILPCEANRGFARLPPPDPGDLFFDMEGDPVYSAESGLEYLFGFHYVDAGAERFTAFWAYDPTREKQAFEKAVDFIMDRLERFPGAFVYHYASYEERALKQLAMQHGTRENEIDALLRGRKLVDLYKVVREGLRTSEPAYSLKNLEVFFAPERTQEIRAGGDSIVAFERWLMLRDDKLLKQIEEYNAFDCRSTRLCRDWLLSLRPDGVAWFDPASAEADEDPAKGEERAERDAAIEALRESLLLGVSETDRLWRELLGHLLEYHRREARSEWWKFFERHDASIEDHIADAECIGGLTEDADRPPRRDKRSLIRTFRFPEQEVKLAPGKRALRAGTKDSFEIVSLDQSERRVELKVGPNRPPFPNVFSLIPTGPYDDGVQRNAVARYATAVGEGHEEQYAAVTGILRKDQPRLTGGVILRDASDLLSGTVDAVCRMERTHLVIQGPPGSGKTHTAAHAIAELLSRGKRIGVTSLSHKAINNLLRAVETVARERGVAFRGVKRSSEAEDRLDSAIIEEAPNNDAVDAGDYQLIGGTAWLFAREVMEQKLDYLFVDEAGQVSLANVVATGISARNIVLVGDQMQLPQPVKGVHPGGSGVSALDHLVGDWATVPPDRGVFLARTWRMHPSLCEVVSQAFYDGELKAVEATAKQRIVLTDDDDGLVTPSGLKFIGVEHDDCSQRSEPEAAVIRGLYHLLLRLSWVDGEGESRLVSANDVLVVSPYNMQVNLLREMLPEGARVGTVDKFQGQEAAVVLVSMTSSNGENIPKGIGFLLSPNRLNVAISRARCLAVVVASPELLAIKCSRIEHMRLVNTLCWMRAAGQEAGSRRESYAR